MGKTTISFPVIAVLISQQNRIVSPQDMMSEDAVLHQKMDIVYKITNSTRLDLKWLYDLLLLLFLIFVIVCFSLDRFLLAFTYLNSERFIDMNVSSARRNSQSVSGGLI